MVKKSRPTKSKKKSLSRTTSDLLIIERTYKTTGRGGKKGKLLKKSTTRIKV